MKRRHGLASKLVIAALFAGALIGVGAPTAANAAVRGVDIQAYCSSVYAGADGRAVTVGSDAYSWRCEVTWNGIFKKNLGIDMNDVCKRRYNNSSTAYLVNNDSSSLYNWRCT